MIFTNVIKDNGEDRIIEGINVLPKIVEGKFCWFQKLKATQLADDTTGIYKTITYELANKPIGL